MTFSKGQTITYKATGEVNTIIKNNGERLTTALGRNVSTVSIVWLEDMIRRGLATVK